MTNTINNTNNTTNENNALTNNAIHQIPEVPAYLKDDFKPVELQPNNLTPQTTPILIGHQLPMPMPTSFGENETIPNDTEIIKFPEFIDVEQSEGGKLRPVGTMSNAKILLDFLGITYKYDCILKTADLDVKGIDKNTDDAFNSQVAKIKSEFIKYSLPVSVVDNYLSAIIDQSSYNPLQEMLRSNEWDGVDRISLLVDTLKSNDEQFYKKFIITMWLIQCVAAWDYIKECPNSDALARFESVLVLVGEQGVTKTKWFENLLPKPLRKYINTGVHLDTHNKDSVKLAITAGITELGELDSTFSKDIASLKAFMSKPVDKMRLPYARAEVEYKRRTSFGASVNDTGFLIDPTGNRRFLPIEINDIDEDLLKSIDKSQLFAQAFSLYKNGEKWWIDKKIDTEVYDYLHLKHAQHMEVSAESEIVEKVLSNTLENEEPLVKMLPLEWKSSTEIAQFYKLPVSAKKKISFIKQALIKANIERKGSNFHVRLI